MTLTINRILRSFFGFSGNRQESHPPKQTTTLFIDNYHLLLKTLSSSWLENWSRAESKSLHRSLTDFPSLSNGSNSAQFHRSWRPKAPCSRDRNRWLLISSSFSSPELVLLTKTYSLSVCAAPFPVFLSGSSVVVFLHGFPEIWYSWRYQMIALADAGFRVLAPDYRGYGLSDSPAEPSKASFSDLISDLLGILDALNIPKVLFSLACTITRETK